MAFPRAHLGDVLAELLLALRAPLAAHARPALPPDPDAIAFLEPGDLTAPSLDVPHDLVAGHEGERRDAVEVVDGLDVGEADTAVADGDPDVMLPESGAGYVSGSSGCPSAMAA